MTDEHKETTADEQVDAESTEETEVETEESADEEMADDSSSINYEDELKKEREAREKAEKALADAAFKGRKQKREAQEEEVVDDLETKAAQIEARLRREIQEERIKEYAGELTENDAEAALVIEVHKNRTFPAHLSLKEQLEESWIIANKKKVLGENSELKRALAAKGSVRRGFTTTQRESEKISPKIAPTMITSLKNAGYTLNKGQWEKSLAGGKKLVFDAKLNRGVVIS